MKARVKLIDPIEDIDTLEYNLDIVTVMNIGIIMLPEIEGREICEVWAGFTGGTTVLFAVINEKTGNLHHFTTGYEGKLDLYTGHYTKLQGTGLVSETTDYNVNVKLKYRKKAS